MTPYALHTCTLHACKASMVLAEPLPTLAHQQGIFLQSGLNFNANTQMAPRPLCIIDKYPIYSPMKYGKLSQLVVSHQKRLETQVAQIIYTMLVGGTVNTITLYMTVCKNSREGHCSSLL